MSSEPRVERTVAVSPNNTVSVRIARKAPDYRAGVDRFFRSTVASYVTSSGRVIVAPTFMLKPGYDDQQVPRDPKSAEHRAVVNIASSAGLSSGVVERLQDGRGTPDEFRAITQAAINDFGSTHITKEWRSIDIRKIMQANATGFDCAGYVQQSYLFATGRTRDQLGWAALRNEGLFNLSGHGFRKFLAVAALRAGDIIVFKSSSPRDPIGHRTIVFDQRVANDDDEHALTAAIGVGTGPSGADFVGTGATIRVLEMDSSYGSNGNPAWGGVQRQTWVFNESTRKWASLWLVDPPLDRGADPWIPQLQVWSIQYVGELYGMMDVLEGFYRHRAD